MRIANEVLMHFRAGKKERNVISFQDPIDSDKDGNGLTLIDVMADCFMMDESYEKKEETEKLYQIVQRLNGRERQVIVMRYGLHDAAALTQQQVANTLGISRSYVSRLEKKALERLRVESQKPN